MRFVNALVLILLFAVSQSNASCMVTKRIDWHWNGTFKVIGVKKNPSTTNELWKQTGGNRKFGGCVLTLETIETYEKKEVKNKPVDAYVVGKPCDSKVGEIIEATLERNCCDVIGSTSTYEFQSCALNARRFVEQRIRNAKTGKMQRLLGGYDFEKSREIDIKTYEKNWEIYDKAIKKRERSFCEGIVDDTRVYNDCVSESERDET